MNFRFPNSDAECGARTEDLEFYFCLAGRKMKLFRPWQLTRTVWKRLFWQIVSSFREIFEKGRLAAFIVQSSEFSNPMPSHEVGKGLGNWGVPLLHPAAHDAMQAIYASLPPRLACQHIDRGASRSTHTRSPPTNGSSSTPSEKLVLGTPPFVNLSSHFVKANQACTNAFSVRAGW